MSLFDTGIRPAIDDHLLKLAAERRDYGDYWSASSAGYCMRKVVFERLGVPYVAEDARKQRVFSSGNIFHSWIQGITKETGLSIAQELELQDEDLMIRGHIDDLVLVQKYEYRNPQGEVEPNDHVSKHLVLYDYKTTHSRSFTYSKGRPMSHYHKYQLGTYMYMLRNMSEIKSFATGSGEKGAKAAMKYFDGMKMAKDLNEARILKISKDDLRMEEQQLMWSDELSSEVRDYWTTLNRYWADKKLPPCTCADHEGGFMANEKWNPFYYNGEPCSLAWYNLHKEKEKV